MEVRIIDDGMGIQGTAPLKYDVRRPQLHCPRAVPRHSVTWSVTKPALPPAANKCPEHGKISTASRRPAACFHRVADGAERA